MVTPGLLLASVDSKNKPNAMAMGAGSVGPLLKSAIFVIWARPSRHTYNLIEETCDFTVNVPSVGVISNDTA